MNAKTRTTAKTHTAVVSSVQEDIVRIRLTDPENQELRKNEVVYILPGRTPGARLKAEVLRVRGAEADAQVYESTVGIGIGDAVEQTAQLLSIKLGPGLLTEVYDGLENPLEALAQGHGVGGAVRVVAGKVEDHAVLEYELGIETEIVFGVDIKGGAARGIGIQNVEIPREYEEAAVVDGYTRLQAFVKVVLPQMRAGIAATAIFCLIFAWNEYAFALLLTSGQAQTAPPFIPLIIGEGGLDWPAVAAGTTLFLLPVVIFTVMLRNQLLRGITFGAVRR